MQRVVITGMGVVSPVGNDIPTFWHHLKNGISGIGYLTKFDTTNFKVKIAAEVKGFDPALYYQEKSEIHKTDLFAQYAMAAAVQAMEDSALSDILPEELGVAIGSGIGGINTLVSETMKWQQKGPSRVSPFFTTMIISNMASGTVAIRFHAQGPCLPVVTACATGTHAIGEAFRTIKYGHATAMIAGGAEASINPMAVAGFTNCMALTTNPSPEGSSIPFDARRSGFVMGEGAGVVILEEYEHAKARGAKIYAEICGYGNTCDAYHITAPHPDAVGAARAITLAMQEAQIADDARLYINAHGTSTPLNDKVETMAIKKALGQKAYRTMVSSTKSMTGHMLGAAGAVEAIACTLAINNGIVPPTIGYEEADPDCDLDYVPNVARVADIDTALSTSLGFGGHNACIALKKL